MSDAEAPFSFRLTPNQQFARRQIPHIKKQFQAGEIALFIQPMPIMPEPDSPQTEPAYIWISVRTWEDQLIVGEIAEAPDLPGMKIGRTMMIYDDHILDWRVLDDAGAEVIGSQTSDDLATHDGSDIPLPDFILNRRKPGYVADVTRLAREVVATTIEPISAHISSLNRRTYVAIACGVMGVAAYNWIGRVSLVVLAIAVYMAFQSGRAADRLKLTLGDNQKLAERGQFVTCCLLLGNPTFLTPGDGDEWCRVIFVANETAEDIRLLQRLCLELSEASENPRAPNHRAVVDFIKQQSNGLSAPQVIPAEFTGGKVVYMADTIIYRNRFKEGYSNSLLFPFLAIPGEAVNIKMIHWSSLEDSPEARAMREPRRT